MKTIIHLIILFILTSANIFSQDLLTELFFNIPLDSSYSSLIKSCERNQLLRKESKNHYALSDKSKDPFINYLEEEDMSFDYDSSLNSKLEIQFYPNSTTGYDLEIKSHRIYSNIRFVNLYYNLILEKLIKYLDVDPKMSYELSGSLGSNKRIFDTLESTKMWFPLDDIEVISISIGIKYLQDNKYDLYLYYYNRDASK